MTRVALVFAAAVALVPLSQSASADEPLSSQPDTVQHCVSAAQAQDETLQGLSYAHSNVVRYATGHPYHLEVSLLGEGNGYYNLQCHIDAQGTVTYQGYKLGGQPVE
ncbi:hypothetical protein [Larsenimonas rhizosphaerae]|uniref:PepSY domain-containing protein n=1 Tax=Larsenimonas rhizosphaerae TaxID=2944682 RepID=A0AA42CXS3_9GAMM|nr:hypothetical protein [Larsenimonas rhizosphaerae]MCM2129555.1 hypothetical protein [Larsenimonas rhizosphaerae]MCX2524213.1 hypothetical protein [Larsenimonas rhizosphaerae]